MRRIKLKLAYDGTNYSGWQIQPNAPTIEGCLDEAIEAVTKEKLHVIGASRTDAGVHGLGNVAVFDTESRIPAEKFPFALNAYLPEDIRVLTGEEVDAGFHPRHCDTQKEYEYRILNSKINIPQLRNYSYHIYADLDFDKMTQAAAYIIGEHDFKSFCSANTQVESTVRTVYKLDLEKRECAYTPLGAEEADKPYEIIIRIRGNGFLYNMVRIIAGTLVAVGKGRIEPNSIPEIINAMDRSKAGETAPAQGLTLMGIEYL